MPTPITRLLCSSPATRVSIRDRSPSETNFYFIVSISFFFLFFFSSFFFFNSIQSPWTCQGHTHTRYTPLRTHSVKSIEAKYRWRTPSLFERVYFRSTLVSDLEKNLRTIPNDSCTDQCRVPFLICSRRVSKYVNVEGREKFGRCWTFLVLLWYRITNFLTKLYIKTIQQVFHWRFTVADHPRVRVREAAPEDRWPMHFRGGLAAVVAVVPWYHRREQVRHVPPPSCLYRVTCRRPKAGTSIDVPLAMLLRDRPTASVDDQRSF